MKEFSVVTWCGNEYYTYERLANLPPRTSAPYPPHDNFRSCERGARALTLGDGGEGALNHTGLAGSSLQPRGLQLGKVETASRQFC